MLPEICSLGAIMDAELALQSDSPAMPLLNLASGTLILGRSSECQLVVRDVTVSRRHAEITVLKGTVTVRDLNSRNGTFVDEERVKTCLVQHGQRVRFGEV